MTNFPYEQHGRIIDSDERDNAAATSYLREKHLLRRNLELVALIKLMLTSPGQVNGRALAEHVINETGE